MVAGGTVNGKGCDQLACYEQACNWGHSRCTLHDHACNCMLASWNALGEVGGGAVYSPVRGGKLVEYTKSECFVKALEFIHEDSDQSRCTLHDSACGCVNAAWSNLGEAGGGTVGDQQYSSYQCFQKAKKSCICAYIEIARSECQ